MPFSKTNRISLVILVSTLLSFFSNSALAAKINCTKATNLIDKLICSTPKLTALDHQLNSLYELKLKTGTSNQQIHMRTTQKTWLSNERNNCQDVACLEKSYQKRIKTLMKVVYGFDFYGKPISIDCIKSFAPNWESNVPNGKIVALKSCTTETDAYINDDGFFEATSTGEDGSSSLFRYLVLGQTSNHLFAIITVENDGGSGSLSALLLLKMNPNVETPDSNSETKLELVRTYDLPYINPFKFKIEGNIITMPSSESDCSTHACSTYLTNSVDVSEL